MPSRQKVIDFLNEELDLEHFKNVEDAKFNGVLVKGTEEVNKVALCTNTTFETIRKARENEADLVITHHGGWKEFDQDLLDEEKKRMKEAELTWYIAHETLDCKERYGISASLAKKLGIEVESYYSEHAGGKVGVTGRLNISEEEFRERLEDIEPEYEVIGSIEGIEKSKIGVVGGGGGAFTPIIKDTADEECEFFITGSAAFYGKIYAHDKEINMIKLKETSSERWGVYALGEQLEQEFPQIQTIKLNERNW